MQTVILVGDCLLLVAILVSSKVLLRSLRHPICLISLWWWMVLSLSNLLPISDIPIGPEVHLIFVAFICSVQCSGILWHLKAKTAILRPAIHPSSKRALTWLAVIIYVLAIYLGFKGYKLERVYGAEYRTLSFSTGDYTSLLYGSYYVQRFAELVLNPVWLVGIVALGVSGVLYNRLWWTIAGLALAIAVSLHGSGRFPLYYFALTVGLTFIVIRATKLRIIVTLVTSALVVVVATIYITNRRGGEEGMDKERMLRTAEAALTNHLLGINLFTAEWNNPSSLLKGHSSWGRVSLFAYPDTIICLGLRRMGVQVSPPIDVLGEFLQRNAHLGADKWGQVVEANAFYTSVFPMYYDFGLIGVILIPAIFTLIVVKHYNGFRRSGSPSSLMVVVFTSVLLMTSIFNAKIVAPEFMLPLYIVLVYTPSKWKKGALR